jgi:hypothetical protein
MANAVNSVLVILKMPPHADFQGDVRLLELCCEL